MLEHWRRRKHNGSLFVLARDDPERFADVFVAYREPLLRFFVKEVMDPETAWDLTAETFAEAFALIDRFRGSTDAEGRAWLWAIARHDLYTWRRKGSVERRCLAELGIDLPSLSDAEYEHIEELIDVTRLRPALSSALAQLTADQREAVQLRVLEELDYKQIAERLGVSGEVARARVSRGLRELAVSLYEPDAPNLAPSPT
jgi:RNA polymerase sigma-70 factor (ECF subfamily)